MTQPDFSTYLQSIRENDKYRRWWSLYTVTDVEGKIRDESQFSPFDFGLMVERKEEQNEAFRATALKEKIERLPVLEGISKYAKNHVLLVGRPGSGKSTALVRLLLEESSRMTGRGDGEIGLGQIPLLVELRQYQTSVLDLIGNVLRRNGLSLEQQEIEQLLDDGRFLLLFDGVNELPNDSARRDLKAFRENYRNAPAIFTTRDLGVGGDLGIEKKLEMQPLNETQMQQFVRAYLPQQGEEMLRRLQGRLREFGQTPLLLWMLALLAEEAQAVRVVRLALEVDLMLGARFAGEVQLRFQEKTVELVEQLEVPQDFKINLLEMTRSGFAVPFFTQLLRDEDSSVRWSAIDTLGNIGGEVAANALISALQDENSSFRWRAAEALGNIGGEVAANALISALQDKNSFVRASAAEVLGKVGSKAIVKHLIFALQDEDSDVRTSAVYALGEIGNEAAVNVLISVLQDENSDARTDAVYALGEIGNEAAVNVLISALQDENSSVRSTAAEVLGKTGNEAAVYPLMSALQNEDSDVCTSAVYALGEIGNEAAVNVLISALQNEDLPFRWRAAEVLGKVGNEAAINRLIFAVQDKDPDVRHEAIFALVSAVDASERVGNEATINILISALQDEDSSVRSTAAYALGEIRNKAAVEPLISALQDKDSDVRWNALAALRNIGNKAAVDALISALLSEDPGVYWNAVIVLGNMGNEAAVNILISALQDEGSSVRWRAAYALGNIGNEAAVNPLIFALQDEDSSVRREAAEALGKIGNEAAVDALITALQDEDSSVRKEAAEALEKIAPDRILPQMWELLLTETYDTSKIILKIQERYQFYNYNLFHSSPVKEVKATQSEVATSNTFIFNKEIGIVQTGEVNVKGNQTGIQHNKSDG